MFVRLKLTTMAGKKFLSPFVYAIEDGEKKLKKLGWLRVKRLEGEKGARVIKSGKLELVGVKRGEFPPTALYTVELDDLSIDRYIKKIEILEDAWRREVIKHEERRREEENRGSAMGHREELEEVSTFRNTRDSHWDNTK